MKKKLFSATLTMLCTVAMLLAATLKMQAQTPAEWKAMKGNVTMYMTNDMGRNGYYDQKPIAELMGHMGETLGPKCVLAVGDHGPCDGLHGHVQRLQTDGGGANGGHKRERNR